MANDSQADIEHGAEIVIEYLRAYGPQGASTLRNYLGEQTVLGLYERQAVLDKLEHDGIIEGAEGSHAFNRHWQLVGIFS